MQEIIMRMMNDEFTGLTPKKKKTICRTRRLVTIITTKQHV